jgi:branched-chain amino acid transport system permease protein
MASVKGGLEAAGSDEVAASGVVAAAVDAAKTAALALALSVPVVALRTEQNMENQLVLLERWGLVASLVVAAFVLRLVYLMHQMPTYRPAIRLVVAYLAALLIALPLVAGFFVGKLTNPLALVSGGVLAVLITLFGRWVASNASNWQVAAAAFDPQKVSIGGLALMVAYPALALLGAGTEGSIKWIDNFGIQIMIYIMLGWGLNIVVGLAGLLDLGYVAFYAVGAYSYALLATKVIPEVWPALGVWAFWICLPLAGMLAAFWGILLGFPVLRLRGDYLAIVTLAFGEIIRLVLINWVDVTQGYAGISGIPRPSFFGLPFNASDNGFAAFFGIEPKPLYRTIFLFYVILGLALLTNWVTLRLRKLPVGRAWEALREDEIACRSLGINTTNTKLTAFAIGAGFGGFAGSFFAARQGFISPESFTFMESAVIVAIVVLGGMGSQLGVAIAAIAMIGGTEILRELEVLKVIFGNDFDPTQYRMLIFGLAMVWLMIWKPRGLIATREPSIFLKESKAISGSLVKEGHG